MGENVTLEDLRLCARGNAPLEISLALTYPSGIDTYLPTVNKALDWIATEFAKTPKERQDRTEDGLSIDLVHSLSCMGFEASHDTTVGGHCDIVIQGKWSFLWLGEAKKHRSYDWLLKGFEQLDKRYATATSGQDHGAVVIYCFGHRIDQVMERWKAKLTEAREDITIHPDPDNDLGFISVHEHRRTGRDYTVRHLPVSLLWDPEDKEAA